MHSSDVMTIENKTNWGELCGTLTNLTPNQSLTFHGLDNVGIPKCTIRLRTENGYLLRLNIKYVPDISGCAKSYLHIGNDAFRTDVDSLTSYKFCDVIWDLEIVSRGHFLWIVYNNSGNVKHSRESPEINVQVLKKGTIVNRVLEFCQQLQYCRNVPYTLFDIHAVRKHFFKKKLN